MTTGGNQRRQRVLAIQNHIVKVGEVNYYVSRALITDVPEMLAIERPYMRDRHRGMKMRLRRNFADRAVGSIL
ncbi:hypothetical protein TUA1478L_04830 [Lactiplantibacillus plantarum]